MADLFEGEKQRGACAFYVARSYVKYKPDDKHQPTAESLCEGKHFHCMHGPEDKRVMGIPAELNRTPRPKTGKGSRRGKIERGESVRVGCPVSFIVKRPYLQDDVAIVKWKPEFQQHRNHGPELDPLELPEPETDLQPAAVPPHMVPLQDLPIPTPGVMMAPVLQQVGQNGPLVSTSIMTELTPPAAKPSGHKKQDSQGILLAGMIEFVTKAERSPAFMQAAIGAITAANAELDRLKEQMEYERRMNPLSLGGWKKKKKGKKSSVKSEADTASEEKVSISPGIAKPHRKNATKKRAAAAATAAATGAVPEELPENDAMVSPSLQNYGVNLHAPGPPVGGNYIAAILDAMSEPGSVSMHSF